MTTPNENISEKRFGWLPDPPDKRDLMYSSVRDLAPQTVILANHNRMPAIMDQSSLGSCTANSIAYLVKFNLLNNKSLQKAPVFLPSRLFIYYYERELINTIPFDSGAYIRDGIKVVAKQGAPSEDLWKYDISRFTEVPPQRAIDYGLKLQSLKYERVNNADKNLTINALLAGYPISCGFHVFPSFVSREVARTGVVPMPGANERVIGGHAVTIVGYLAQYDSYIIANSWGTGWGQSGYCRMPAAYLNNPQLAEDFWIITEME